MVDFERYRQEVLRTASENPSRRERLLHGALGLCAESGEVADLVKKTAFMGHPLDEQKLRDELGDIMWYFVLICDALGFTMEEVIAGNIAKLRRRYPDGFSAERSINREDVR